MKDWHKPHKSIEAYVNYILVLDDFGVSDSFALSLYANGMPNLLFKTSEGLVGNKVGGPICIQLDVISES